MASLSPRAALAQDSFFRVSPGALDSAHAKFDNSDGCPQCHKLGGGVSDELCLQCHDHEPLRLAIAKGHGLHASFKQRCVLCHHQHKGREAPSIDWAQLGGREHFAHASTGFALAGEHAKASCTACHKSKLASGRTSYMGLAADCHGCHKNPHGFSDPALAQGCDQCHLPGVMRDLRAADLKFDHAKVSGVALLGKHAATKCVACHKNANMAHREPPRDCRDCHKTSHGPSFRDKPCAKCHSPERPFKSAFFNHDTTEFVLRGKHATAKCSQCHLSPSVKPKRQCLTCHQDTHRGRFATLLCEDCHKVPGLPVIEFEHATKTKFALLGKHAKATCRQCHRGAKPYEFERLVSLECVECHSANDKHQGKLGRECGKCHAPDGGAPKFEHKHMTRFALTGAHDKVPCAFCHRPPFIPGPPAVGWTLALVPGKPPLSFQVAGHTCAECHRDTHASRYGSACDSCHNTTRFKDVTRIVHDTGAFRLDGQHRLVPCARCHREGISLAGTGPLCQSCHFADDVHSNGLGPLCGDCHGQDAWMPARFSHNSTAFPLRGVHRTAPCRACHGVGTFVGTAVECADCHAADAQGVREPVHVLHFAACQNCHVESAFAPARRYHPTYPLRGLHAALACRACHAPGVYIGTPTECEGCHMADFSKPANSPNHVQAGFSPRCADCHSPLTWRSGHYEHQTFILRGAHRGQPCVRCHPGSSYQGAFNGQAQAWDCAACHAPGTPVDRCPLSHATAGYPLTCELCHGEAAWIPTRGAP